MPVEEHLLPGEIILASSGSIHATDRRVLRYEPAPITGDFTESLDYLTIQGIRPGVHTKYRLIVLSFLALLLGLIDPLDLQARAPFFTLVMAVGGLVGLVYGILNRKTVWTIVSSQVSKARQANWQIQDDNERSRRLIQVVQARMGKPPQVAQEDAPAASPVNPDSPASQRPEEQQR